MESKDRSRILEKIKKRGELHSLAWKLFLWRARRTLTLTRTRRVRTTMRCCSEAKVALTLAKRYHNYRYLLR